tara:strand:+ start:754 stop:930 length:177 start_codon:yes stop_codon:yes gene_type:complete
MTISLEKIKERVKKRKGWVALGNTLFITGFLSFSNHPNWGIWCSAIGFIITLIALLKK